MPWLKWALGAFGFLFFLTSPRVSTAEMPLEKLSVLALAPLEERAVVKSPHGALHVVRHGDALPGTSAKVLQVLPDKLVVEAWTGSQPERGKHLVWIYKAPQAGGGSRVLRLPLTPPTAAPALSPAAPLTNRPQR